MTADLTARIAQALEEMEYGPMEKTGYSTWRRRYIEPEAIEAAAPVIARLIAEETARLTARVAELEAIPTLHLEYTNRHKMSASATHCDHCGLPDGKHVEGCTFDIMNELDDK